MTKKTAGKAKKSGKGKRGSVRKSAAAPGPAATSEDSGQESNQIAGETAEEGDSD